MSNIFTHHTTDLYKAVEDDWLFAASFLKVKSKNMTIVPFDFNAAQLDFYRNRTGRDIILKARQHGFSTLLQARKFKLSLTQSFSGITLSDTDDNTQKLRWISQRFYDYLPEVVRPPNRSKTSVRSTSYEGIDSEVICITAGAKTAGRGGTYSFMHASEVAFWRDTDSVFAGALQAMTPNAEIYLESTPNGIQGRFYELCMASLEGEPVWKLHFYPWWWAKEYSIELDENEKITPTEEEELTIQKAAKEGFVLNGEQLKWRRSKIVELKDVFFQEYPEDIHTAFLTSGGGVFDYNRITFIDDRPEYNPEHIYAAGIDWGQDDDYTILSISDRTDNRQVYLGGWRKLPWMAMRDNIIKQLVRFHVTIVRPERNMATSQIESLWSAIEAVGLVCELKPFTTSAISKHELITFYRGGLEDYGYALLDDDTQKRELMTYETKRTTTGMYVYSAPSGGHDDTVIAGALSYIAMVSLDQ